MKYLILMIFLFSCLEETAEERVKRLEKLETDQRVIVETSVENYTNLKSQNMFVDFSITKEGIDSEEPRSDGLLRRKSMDETIFVTDEDGLVVAREFRGEIHEYLVTKDSFGVETERFETKYLKKSFSEKKEDGSLGANEEFGHAVITLDEIHEKCLDYIVKYTKSSGYNVVVKRADNYGIITDCYYVRKNTSSVEFKNGFENIKILLNK